jgi:tight adherence protein B
MTTMILSISAAALVAFAVLMIVFAIRGLLVRDANVDARLSTYLNTGMAEDAPPQALIETQFTERLNEVIKRQSFAERIERDLAQANVPLTVSEYLLLRIGVILLAALIALFVWRSVLMIAPAMAIGFLLPVFWLRARRKKRNRDFNDQLAETLALVATSMRGGFSLIQSLANVARDSQEPTKSELRRVGQEVQLGLSLPQALDNLVVRMESEDLDLVVTAIKIHARVGGNLTMILENISSTIRERAKLRREVRVITSMQRISSYVIGFLPFGLGLIIFTINPTYMARLFQPGWTLCIPIGAVFFAVVGFVVIQRIVDIKV